MTRVVERRASMLGAWYPAVVPRGVRHAGIPGEPAPPMTEIDRVRPAQRPGRAVWGWQRWRHLLFMHWPVPVDTMRAVVPRSFDLDLHDGTAYVGVVPFAMEGVRPRISPEFAALDFLETNVRTYVVRNGEPGVYFLSLEAGSRLAVATARAAFAL